MNKKTRDLYYTIWTLSILLCVILALFALFLPALTKSDVEAEATPTPSVEEASAADAVEVTPEPTPEPTPVPVETQLAETNDAGQEYIDSITFAGDSMTYQLYTDGLVDREQVWSGSSGSLSLTGAASSSIAYYGSDGSSLNMTISEAAAIRKPAVLIITFSSYDLANMDQDSFTTAYRQIIESVQSASPDTVVITQSLFPVIESELSDGMTNAQIQSANGWLLNLAEETGSYYLDTYSALTDSTGSLYSGFDSGDGRHLTVEGNETVLSYIRMHAYPLDNSDDAA